MITANDDNDFLFVGEIKKGSKNKKFETILFSSNRTVLKQLYKNDWIL